MRHEVAFLSGPPRWWWPGLGAGGPGGAGGVGGAGICIHLPGRNRLSVSSGFRVRYYDPHADCVAAADKQSRLTRLPTR